MIDCREAVRRMWLYLEEALEQVRNEELEQHLETCTRCCGELEFSRRLRDMVADRAATPGMPPDLRRRVELLLVSTEPEQETTG